MMIEDLNKDQVVIKKGLLNKQQLGLLQQRSASIFENKSSLFSSSYFAWTPDITDQYRSSIVLLQDLEDDELIRPIIKDYCENFVGRDCTKAILTFFTSGSYIPWHSDKHFDAAITLYVYDYDWQDGGMFLYLDEDDQIKGYVPRAGEGVYLKNTWHTVTPVLPNREPRVTVQCWFMDD